MPWYFYFSHTAAFIAGWAFFKHRASIKAAAVHEANQLRASAASKIAPRN